MAELTPVRGIVTTPQTEPLSGIKTSYGVTVGATGATERWAYAPTPDSAHGGVYDVTTAGVWTRAADLDASAEFNTMPWFQVEEGNSRIKGSTWYYSGSKNPTLGTTPLPFTKRSYGDPEEPGAGLEASGNALQLIERAIVAGRIDVGALSITHTNRGVTSAIVGGYGQETYIEGLRPRRDGDIILTFLAGAAWSDVDQQVIELINPYVTEGGYNVSEWRYFYLRTGNTGAYVQGDPTAPTLYAGDAARHPTWGARYLHAHKSAATALGYNFSVEGDGNNPLILYREVTNVAPFRILSGGTATAVTTVSCSAVAPPTSRMAWMRLENTATSGSVQVFHENLGNSGITLLPGEVAYTRVGLNASQVFSYRYSAAPTGGSFNADLLGYWDRR
jgi:hypothetical protein